MIEANGIFQSISFSAKHYKHKIIIRIYQNLLVFVLILIVFKVAGLSKRKMIRTEQFVREFFSFN